MSVTNSDRARTAQVALTAFVGAVKGLEQEDACLQIKDLVTDLYHLCDRLGVEFKPLAEAASGMYVQESFEDEAGDWPIAKPADPSGR